MPNIQAYVGILSLYFFYLSCRTITKIYSQKSKIFKIIFCIGLFFAGSFLSIFYFLFWYPNVSAEYLGELTFSFFGFFSSLISEILEFIKIRKERIKKAKEYKSVRNSLITSVVLLIGMPILVIIYLAGSIGSLIETFGIALGFVLIMKAIRRIYQKTKYILRNKNNFSTPPQTP